METIKITDYKDHLEEIYFVGGQEASTVKELLLAFYQDNTVCAGNALATYSDPEYTEIQCRKHKIRSLENVLSIIITYFSETTFEEAINAIISLDVRRPNSSGSFVFIPTACSDIAKITVHYFNLLSFMEYTQIMNNIRTHKFDSVYSWYSILKSLNINNILDLSNKIYENR